MKISVLSMQKQITEMDLDGYAVGGLAVGETHEEMYQYSGCELYHIFRRTNRPI